MNTTKIDIKSVYMYYDEKYKAYNMFIFFTFCSVGFCVHRVADDVSKFYWLQQTMYHSSGAFAYIYEKPEYMAASICHLKKRFPLKKKNIYKTLPECLRCFDCFSCNPFVYMLSLAYAEHPEKVRTDGIYCNYEKHLSPMDKHTTILSECLESVQNMVITDNPDVLATKITVFLDSGYDLKTFYGEDGGGYTCDYEGCEAYPDDLYEYDERLFHCSGCSGCYQLCDKHCTETNIAEHCRECHSDNEVNITFGIKIIKPTDLDNMFSNYRQY